MPVIDGKVVRSRYTGLKLNEISSVDNPAQPGAIASIVKRGEPAQAPAQPSIIATSIAKYVGDEDGAHTFQEVLQANQFDEEIWPMVSALSQSIRSIMGDREIKAGDKEQKVTQSVDEFLATVRSISPEVATESEKRLARLISKRTEPMPKTVEQLEAEIATLKTQLGERDQTISTEKARAEKAEADLTAERTAHTETKKSLIEATDEVITVGGQEIRKSVAGEGSFSVAKALRDERDMARLEKRADEEFGHLPGTTGDRANVLKAAEAMPEETRKAFDAIMTSAEKLAGGGFDRIGGGGGNGGGTGEVKKAQADFDAKVEEIEKRDSCSKHDAMSRARHEAPALFEALQDAA